MAVIVRPATRDDIDTFSERKSYPTIKAWVGEIDGKIIALGGMALAHGRYFAFLDLTEDARPYKMTLARSAIRFLKQAEADGIRFIYADRSEDEPRATEWLISLGFEPDPRAEGRFDNIYRWKSNGRNSGDRNSR